MVHLPNEIWFLIANFSDPRDIWLGLRHVNRQLQQCAEEYFEKELLPQIVLNLPVGIPTYDMRTQTRGKAIFQVESTGVGEQRSNRVSYQLSGSEPALYRIHILSCWDRMCASAEGSLSEKTTWEMELGGRISSARLRMPMVDWRKRSVVQDHGPGEAKVSFDWKPSMTTFFR